MDIIVHHICQWNKPLTRTSGYRLRALCLKAYPYISGYFLPRYCSHGAFRCHPPVWKYIRAHPRRLLSKANQYLQILIPSRKSHRCFSDNKAYIKVKGTQIQARPCISFNPCPVAIHTTRPSSLFFKKPAYATAPLGSTKIPL